MALIHADTHDYSAGPRWQVEQDPTMAGRPDLVRFTKQSQARKLLDQIARWDGAGWDPARWVPKHPQVPQTLLAIVEAHMRSLHR
jgi:hypothetical protein